MTKKSVRKNERVATPGELEAAWWAHQLGAPSKPGQSSKREARPEPDEVTLEPEGASVEAEPRQPPAFRTVDPIVAEGRELEGQSPDRGTSSEHALHSEPSETMPPLPDYRTNQIWNERHRMYAGKALKYLALVLVAVLLGWLVAWGMSAG